MNEPRSDVTCATPPTSAGPIEQPEVAERGHRRDRARAAPAAGAEDDRRVQRDARAAECEPDERDRRARRDRRQEAAAGREQPAPDEQRPLAEPRALAVEAPDRHRRAEDARPEPADGGRRVELALEEERAPALDAALDDERDRAEDPEPEQRALDVGSCASPRSAPARCARCRAAPAVSAISTATASRIVSRCAPALRARPAPTAPTRMPTE